LRRVTVCHKFASVVPAMASDSEVECVSVKFGAPAFLG
jgi:hypothetical protein